MRKVSIFAAIIVMAASLIPSYVSAQKKALGHDDFDNWKSVKNQAISNNGEWCAFAVNPQEGDGVLTFYNSKTGKKVEVQRGYNAKFTADGLWGVALVKPLFAETRKAKIDKKKDHEMPQDSLAIVNLKTLEVKKIGSVNSFSVAKDAGDWIAFKSCDTTLITPKQLKDDDTGRPLVVFNPATKARKVIKWVDDYTFSRNGAAIALSVKKPDTDSITTNGVGILSLPDTSYTVVDRDKKFYGAPVFSHDGKQFAYTASNDTADTGTIRTNVYLGRTADLMKSPTELLLEFKNKKGEALVPNQYTDLKFSHNGKRLIAGVAPIIAPDDTTIVDFEQGKLDIWVWNADYTPPQEQKLLDEIREKNFPVVIDLATMHPTLLSDNLLEEVKAPNRWDGDYALLIDPTESIVSYQWDYFAPTQMYTVNVNTGAREEVGEFMRAVEPQMSPDGRYIAWFRDRNYYVYSVADKTTKCVSADVASPLWDVDDRHPSPAEPYGIAGWSENDAALLVYDKYDIWSLDPAGRNKSFSLTDEYGKKNNLKIRYKNTDPEHRYLKRGDKMLLTLFDYCTKYNGLGEFTYGPAGKPTVNVLEKRMFSQILKAKDADTFTWQSSNFSTSPNIWMSRGWKFAQARMVTDANPQMKDYSWGTAQLERWYAYDGNESEGVLYVPENYDPSKKYPMLCVFYETGSEDLYYHYTMEPSWSWVNYPFYVSRGYVVFVPDIHYTSGRPGEDAYNYVCSGVEEMCRRYPWIDKDRIGIDGQSWGGYQTAYLVTRTNMFACAGSGAPVANMTSAYGGIRWESGDSRMPQYEQGQSRIGGTLWERPEMYISSSPVFHADRCNTPLLIMHNDNDGAVPWYQGIELFMALRRLQKPVWMLQYNGESHNIRARKNRKDITKRLQQFFDHYLKGDPMPKWMKEGVPMIRKGQEWGFDLTETTLEVKD